MRSGKSSRCFPRRGIQGSAHEARRGENEVAFPGLLSLGPFNCFNPTSTASRKYFPRSRMEILSGPVHVPCLLHIVLYVSRRCFLSVGKQRERAYLPPFGRGRGQADGTGRKQTILSNLLCFPSVIYADFYPKKPFDSKCFLFKKTFLVQKSSFLIWTGLIEKDFWLQKTFWIQRNFLIQKKLFRFNIYIICYRADFIGKTFWFNKSPFD